MHLIASQKFQITGQQVGRSNGQASHSNARRDELVIGRFAPAPVGYQDDGYYWTDEGYEHLRDGKDFGDHRIPLIIVPLERHMDEALLEEIARVAVIRSLIVAVCFLGAAVLLAGYLGLERVETASVIAARV